MDHLSDKETDLSGVRFGSFRKILTSKNTFFFFIYFNIKQVKYFFFNHKNLLFYLFNFLAAPAPAPDFFFQAAPAPGFFF